MKTKREKAETVPTRGSEISDGDARAGCHAKSRGVEPGSAREVREQLEVQTINKIAVSPTHERKQL
jgi:hypothetical protein